MRKKLKDLLILLIFFTILILLLKNSSLIINSIQNSTTFFITRLFSSLFPFLVIGNILINQDISYYLYKLFRIKNNLIIFILSLMSGFPSSAKYIKEMYLNNNISLEEANNIIKYTFFANPMFLITILSISFTKYYVVAIILSHYLANIVIYLFSKEKIKRSTIYKNNTPLFKAISNSIKDTINTMLLILGTISFYNIIITLINIYLNNKLLRSFFTGLLEFSQGLNSLNNLNTLINIKAFMAVIFISFGSLSIHSQIKSIINDTNISYKSFFKARIFHSLIAILLLSSFILLYKLFL